MMYNFLPQKIFQNIFREDFCTKNLTLDIKEPIDALQKLSNVTDTWDFESMLDNSNFSKFADDVIQYIHTFKVCTSEYKQYINHKQEVRDNMLNFADSWIDFGEYIFEKEAKVFLTCHSIKSLWPIDLLWRHRSGSILVQAMACDGSHCLNWFAIWNHSQTLKLWPNYFYIHKNIHIYRYYNKSRTENIYQHYNNKYQMDIIWYKRRMACFYFLCVRRAFYSGETWVYIHWQWNTREWCHWTVR